MVCQLKAMLRHPVVSCALSAERNPPIDEVIKQNVIPQFVTFLRRADMPQLQVCVYVENTGRCKA